MVELLMMEYLTALGMTMVFLFLDSRYSRRRTILMVYGTVVLVMTLLAAIYRVAGLETTLRIYTLIAHAPSLLLFLTLSRFRGWRLVFQLLSAILFCTLIHHGAVLAYYLFGCYTWVLVLSLCCPQRRGDLVSGPLFAAAIFPDTAGTEAGMVADMPDHDAVLCHRYLLGS